MTVFYRKYRPQKLVDLVGQEYVKKTLLSQLASGKISHGYLFAGPRGTGKTSTARIFAKAVNCQKVDSSQFTVHSKKKSVNRQPLAALRLRSGSTVNHFGEPCNRCVSCLAVVDGSHLDLLEIDAASNRGIDEIRDLREKIKLSPVLGRFKIYIIDEAHMLTPEAFNALLKTLEEPPAHAIFILCTTAPGKLPPTIISRLTRFNFKRAKDDELVRALRAVSQAEGLQVEESAFLKIAKIADGSFRDAVSFLDQLAALGGKIGVRDVYELGRVVGWRQTVSFLETLSSRDLKEAIVAVADLEASGDDVSLFTKELVLTLERLMLVKIGAVDSALADVDSVTGEIHGLAAKFSFGELQNIMRAFLVAESEMKIYPMPAIPLILAVCKICPEPREEVKEVSPIRQVFDSEVAQTRGAQGKQVSKVSEVLRRSPRITSQSSVISRRSPRITSQSSVISQVSKVSEVSKVSKVSKGEESSISKAHTKKAKGKLKSLSEVEAKWGEFLEKVRKVNVHLVAILRSSRPAGISGDILTIEVFYRFHKDKLEEPKIVSMLEGFLGEVFKTGVTLRFILAEKQKVLPRAVAESDVVDASREDLTKVTAEIFSK